MRVLLLGFDPFGGELINPAWEVVKRVAEDMAGVSVIPRQVPTVFDRAIEHAVVGIITEKPDLVIAVGQAGGRGDIGIERVAININDAAIPDNKGNQPRDTPVVEGAPSAYFATLPIKAIVTAIQEVGIPASISNTAGTFVCNHIMYGILHHIADRQLRTRAGFIHVPYLPEQAVNHKGAPSMGLADMVTALEVAITAAKLSSMERM